MEQQSMYQEELQAAKRAAREAGALMQEYQENGFSVEHKDVYTDLVTDADKACQEKIIEILSEAFPDDGFLAEEDEMTPDGENRVWVIDPIDGTKNYSHGFPFYCTSIALKVDGKPVVGVVYAPAQDELFSAVRGQGAWLNGEEISVSDADELRDALIIARLSDRREEVRVRENKFLREVLRAPSAFRRMGSAALDLCYVACGRTDGHALVTINEWDVAAGGLIVEEAGGAFRCQEAVFGQYLETVSSNGNLQDSLEQLFDEYVRTED